MTQSDAYYRALLAYKKLVDGQRECARDSRAFADAEGQERAEITRVACVVDEEWIREIETGLIYIEKAIKEDRQFIYSNGEVVEIEKVKHVSKDSVEHLARHASLITRLPEEGENLMPDKLYTVERISDYTVYENRFLYMLLCYLRDFVALRYRQILDLTNRYDGRMQVKKEVAVYNRKVQLELSLTDEHRDDAWLREHNPNRELIDRMDLILKTILAFLATPLMDSVSKVAMLKPPITKTNVLKMDNNFKHAVALYEYIIAYEGPGYTAEETVKELSPFRAELAEDLAQAELLAAFLLYEHGLGLEQELKHSLEADETAARQEQLRRTTQQLEQLRRRLEREGQPPESYILHLEKQVRALQNEADRIEPLHKQLEALQAEGETLRREKQTLAAAAEAAEQTLARKLLEHEEEMRAAAVTFQKEKAALKESHLAATLAMEKAHGQALEKLRERHEEQLSAVQEDCRRAMDELNADWGRKTAQLEGSLTYAQTQLREQEEENRGMKEELALLRAQALAKQAAAGQITDAQMQAMTTQEGFDELESQYEAFTRFYKEQWGRTKRSIRKELLNFKFIKGQSDKN